MVDTDIISEIRGLEDVLVELEESTDLNTVQILQKVLITHVDELNKRNEALEAENKRLRNELNCFNMNNNANVGIQEAVGVAKHHASTYSIESSIASENEANLAFTFTTDNPLLQMAELTKEMEALRSSYQLRDNTSVHSGHGSENGVSENGSDSSNHPTSAASDMARVQKCQHRIQQLEKEAERARFNNRHLMQQYAEQLKDKSRILGEAVAKARPYFDALKKAKTAKQRTQFLANQYTRAQQVLRASRELVKASEEKMMACGLKTEEDMQWLEMLNEANDKANEASLEKTRIQQLHEESAQNYRLSEEVAATMLKAEQRSIKKAKSYFDLKIELETKLEESRRRMQNIDLRVVEAKAELSTCLQRLGSNNLMGSVVEQPQSDTTSIVTTDSEVDPSKDKDAESIVDGFIEDF